MYRTSSQYVFSYGCTITMQCFIFTTLMKSLAQTLSIYTVLITIKYPSTPVQRVRVRAKNGYGYARRMGTGTGVALVKVRV